MPRTNQQVSQFFCIKHKYHQLQKLWSSPEHMSRGLFLWVYWIGLWIDHKNSISKGLRIHEVFLFPRLEQNRLQHRQPCRHLWLWGPKRLKDVFSLFSTTHKSLVKTAVHQCDSMCQNTRLRKLEVNSEKGLEQREQWEPRYRLQPNSREEDSDDVEEGCHMWVGHIDTLITYMQ